MLEFCWGLEYDNYTAKKEGVESTGNAVRGGLAPYTSTPTLEATNFTFSPGNKSPGQKASSAKLITGLWGARSPQQQSRKIEKGSVAYAVKGVMLAGVIFDVLRNVSALGNNTRKIGYIVARVRVENVKVVGR